METMLGGPVMLVHSEGHEDARMQLSQWFYRDAVGRTRFIELYSEFLVTAFSNGFGPVLKEKAKDVGEELCKLTRTALGRESTDLMVLFHILTPGYDLGDFLNHNWDGIGSWMT